jgi:carbonic anhydrase
MSETKNRWIESILLENERFRKRISPDKLPVQRTPGSLAVITCMDPRVNLEAIGIPGFTQQGEGTSSVRIIRSIGAMAEHRSLVIGIFLAGIREVVVLMHTDCGCCLAFSKIDTIIENMKKTLNRSQFQAFKTTIGEPFRDQLIDWLKVFEEPRDAIRKEIASIKSLPFVPDSVIFHGLLYDLTSGDIEVVVNGYDQS